MEPLVERKQLNVQEQNDLTKNRIQLEAKYWRKRGIPNPLQNLLEEKGIDLTTSIFLEYELDYPGSSTDTGVILTEDGKFFEFEMDLNRDRTELIGLYLWEDSTNNYVISEHEKGIGKTYGFLALEVLGELNEILA